MSKKSGAKLVWRPERKAFEIQWFVKGRRRRLSTGTSVRAEADAALARHILETTPAGSLIPSGAGERLIGNILADYAIEQAPYTSAPKQIGYAILALEPFWGGKPYSAVTRVTCRDYAAHRQKAHIKRLEAKGKEPKPLSNGTLRKELEILRAALNHDKSEGRIPEAPTVFLPERPASRDRVLTLREVAKLVRAARAEEKVRDYLPDFIYTVFYTAGRKTAALELRWPQIDFSNGLIDFNPKGRVQTSKRRPVVPLHRKLKRRLLALRSRGTPDGYVFHINQEPIGNIKRGFANACKRAGLKGVTPHTLRHTAATLMRSKGVHEEDIAQFLGHTNPETTRRNYIHQRPEFLKDAMRAYG
jgi:integrase